MLNKNFVSGVTDIAGHKIEVFIVEGAQIELFDEENQRTKIS
jgi:hypothetical protein